MGQTLVLSRRNVKHSSIIAWSVSRGLNPSGRFETDPGIFFLGRRQIVVDSVVE